MGGNTEKSLSALESLVAGDEAGGLNSAEGAMRLQAMMQGENLQLDKGKKLKSEFGAITVRAARVRARARAFGAGGGVGRVPFGRRKRRRGGRRRSCWRC